MGKLKEGQSEIVSGVLIFGIVISLVGATYIWGVPLIQKQQSFGEAQQVEDFMRNLDQKIEEVDKGGRNSRNTVSITETGILNINETNESITFNTFLKGTYYIVTNESDTAWNPVEWGPIENGIFGKDSPSVIRAKASTQGDGYDVTYEIKYRPLIISSTGNTYEIDIVEEEDQTTGVEGDEITIVNLGQTKDGDDTRSRIRVFVNA